MQQPHSPDIRLYCKVRKTLDNLLQNKEEREYWNDLYTRLSSLKVELEVLHPGIASLAPDDPREYEEDNSEELS